MFIRRHPLTHFVVAVLLAIAAAFITAAGPLLVLSASFGVPPELMMQWNIEPAASQPSTTLMAAQADAR